MMGAGEVRFEVCRLGVWCAFSSSPVMGAVGVVRLDVYRFGAFSSDMEALRVLVGRGIFTIVAGQKSTVRSMLMRVQDFREIKVRSARAHRILYLHAVIPSKR